MQRSISSTRIDSGICWIPAIDLYVQPATMRPGLFAD